MNPPELLDELWTHRELIISRWEYEHMLLPIMTVTSPLNLYFAKYL